MKNMKDRVTIYEVARASGVSLATVSRVINKKGNVTEETRRRVEETIVRLGYKPSAVAQALATSKSTNIGIVIPSANYVYISNMLSGMIRPELFFHSMLLQMVLVLLKFQHEQKLAI